MGASKILLTEQDLAAALASTSCWLDIQESMDLDAHALAAGRANDRPAPVEQHVADLPAVPVSN